MLNLSWPRSASAIRACKEKRIDMIIAGRGGAVIVGRRGYGDRQRTAWRGARNKCGSKPPILAICRSGGQPAVDRIGRGRVGISICDLAAGGQSDARDLTVCVILKLV